MCQIPKLSVPADLKLKLRFWLVSNFGRAWWPGAATLPPRSFMRRAENSSSYGVGMHPLSMLLAKSHAANNSSTFTGGLPREQSRFCSHRTSHSGVPKRHVQPHAWFSGESGLYRRLWSREMRRGLDARFYRGPRLMEFSGLAGIVNSSYGDQPFLRGGCLCER